MKDQVNAGFNKLDYSGLSPKNQLKTDLTAHPYIGQKTVQFTEEVALPLLEQNGIVFRKADELNADQLKFIEDYFLSVAYPVLTPMAVDSSRPFPLILNKSLNVASSEKQEQEQERFICDRSSAFSFTKNDRASLYTWR